VSLGAAVREQPDQIRHDLDAAHHLGGHPQLGAAMISRPIKWDPIADQHDQMIKYATAIRTRSAQTAAILRRFQQTNLMHPTYQAMLEVGRAQRSVFAARYQRDRELQREINAGLNVSESWNADNSIIYFGKGGDIPANRRDEQEVSVLCLRVLQAAVVYLNTLMVHDVLDEGVAVGAGGTTGLDIGVERPPG
jgi:TnpA family transposase